MRGIADGVAVEASSSGASRKLERMPEPIFRFDDPARRFSDGTIWAWGRTGRPAAVLTLAQARAAGDGSLWLTELTSLAPGPISATVPGVGKWVPSGPGVVMVDLPGASPPADGAAKRLRQMKELVGQVKAYEFFEPDNAIGLQRYELRILPQPLQRYADPDSGLIDGGLFLISYGQNPELVLVVEARRKEGAAPRWTFGLARISIAEVHVEFRGKEIWSHPGGFSRGPQDIYWLFTLPARGE
jgi:hypothetical protein